MIEEQSRIEVVLEIHLEPQSALFHRVEVRLLVDFAVLPALGLPAPCANTNALVRHTGDVGQRGECLTSPAPHRIRGDFIGRGVLLDVQPFEPVVGGAVHIDRE